MPDSNVATAAPQAPPHAWIERQRPPRLERRLELANYDAIRDLLEQTGLLSERTGIYPNLSFGRTYVNLTLFADEASGSLTPELLGFARDFDALAAECQEAPRS